MNGVEHTATGKIYAMKTLSKKTIQQTKNVAMIHNERNILSKLKSDSKWISGMHFAFQNPENCYLVLTLATGGDLRYHFQHMNKGKPLDEKRIAFYVRGLACALKEIHAARIIHRDIKPENVVISESGYAMLTDFGISKEMDADGMCVGSSGTRMYMPPEALKAPHKQDKRCDSFSLAVTILEIGCGQKAKHGVLISSEALMKSSDDQNDNLVDFDALKVSDNCKDFLKNTLRRKTRKPHHT